MGSRVYDPIHDVFQSREDQEDTNSASEVASSLHPGSDDEDGGDSTQSDDNATPANGADLLRRKPREPSKYTRHLKKADGEYFTRREIQYEFLHELCSDRRPLFTNRYQNFFAIAPTEESEHSNVTDDTYVARKFIKNDKLTFSENYLLTVASSTKCSKILRDKLLFDHNIAFSTCALSLLVNTGRLNTTINFFLEMTSQLRTFHSIPCLQRDARDPKSLQDTPRLKSILKNLPKGNGNLALTDFYESPEVGKKLDSNPVNLIFHLCDNSVLVNLKFVQEYVADSANLTFFDILENPDLDPKQRAQFTLWLIYVHLETDMTESAIVASLELFGIEGKFELNSSTDDVDIDTSAEIEFGELQKKKRREFLIKNNRLPHNAYGSQDDNKSLMEQTKLEKSLAEGADAAEEESPSVKRRGSKLGTRGASRTTSKTNLRSSSKSSKESEPESSKSVVKPPVAKRAYRKQVKRPLEQAEDNDTEPPVKEELQKPSALEETEVKTEAKSDPKPDNVPITQPPRKRQKKKTVSASPATQEIRSDLLDEKKKDEMEELIKFDKSEKIADHRTQDAVMQELERSQALARRKREELGLIKMFHEFEDVTMATVIGVRGKKRKKFKDGLLGFETDFIRTINGAKRALLLNRKDQDDSIYRFT
ncbi:LANO_0B02564g1_1 [Lachancea nothofagi CBS 11611]|uniref:LANO_0B02564g1_1 n=1 Tax=Lachancea nothofagi CBS 11611 TaxID=1266666 RepID=A0A1G4IW96_9SACH|nr:LANO_0B02564g1_1 [Lachancea nothofagi CBS 11611]